MESIANNGINKRRLVFYFMFLSFMVLPVSGFLLHVASKGAVDEQMRHACMAVHNLVAIVFLITVVMHLTFNARGMIAYVRTKRNASIPRIRELLIAAIVVGAMVVIGVRHAFR